MRAMIMIALFPTLCLSAHDAATGAPAGHLMVLAHRGVVTDTIPENSLASLEETIRRGYTHIEVDVRPTKDGHAVVLHDRGLMRTMHIHKYLDDLTLAELRKIAPEDKVPSFETFCATAEGSIGLMPDLKECPDGVKDAFLKSVETSMTKHHLMDTAYFIGGDDLKQHFLGKGGHISWGVSLEQAQQQAPNIPDVGTKYYIFKHAAGLNKKNIDGFHALGLKVIVSINTFHYHQDVAFQEGLADVKRMAALGVDGLQIDSVYAPAVPGWGKKKDN